MTDSGGGLFTAWVTLDFAGLASYKTHFITKHKLIGPTVNKQSGQAFYQLNIYAKDELDAYKQAMKELSK